MPNLSKLFTILRVVVTLLPIIIDTIKAVEEAIPGQGEGEKKLALVRETLETAFKVIDQTSVSFEDIWSVIASQIKVLVAIFNAKGIFGK